MTKEEAIKALEQGKKIRHRFFADDEFVCMNKDGQYEFEDGVKMTKWEFWQLRPESYWLIDWEIKN